MSDRAYFEAMTEALVEAGLHRPVLVIDRDRLDANIEAIRERLAPGLGLRIVDKSLPSIPLMRRIMAGCRTTHVMSFHLPMTLSVLSAFPETEVLFGKPVPVGALISSAGHLPPSAFEDLLRRCVFLIDSMDRLDQYAAFASPSAQTIRIAFEIDTGMHRGGFDTPDALVAAIERAEQSGAFSIEGVMGYDAHIAQMPGFLGGAREKARVEARIDAFVSVLPHHARRIVNTGGSKTALTYRSSGVANEVSIGSAFVKPTDFDVDILAALQPATFIATPILKVGPMRLPGPPFLTRFMQALGRFPKKGCFLYGGKWMGDPVYPFGMQDNKVWGHSSNQQMMALPNDSDAKADDFAFFRPTQSEAVFQSFDGLHVLSQGRIVEKWSALSTGWSAGFRDEVRTADEIDASLQFDQRLK